MKWWKVALVIVGAVILTSFAIDAADTLTGEQGTMLAQLIDSNDSDCPEDMVAVSNISSLSCADRFEAAPGDGCAISEPSNILESNQNIQDPDCEPVAQSGEEPWRFITREQAMQACARVGKRLPTSGEWYQLSLGIHEPERVCNVSSGSLSHSGTYEACVSPSGAYDMIGNAWEWVGDDVIDGTYKGRALPETGYVAQVDVDGMATVSTSTEPDGYGGDYFWTKQDGAHGILRGGFYDSGTDAGSYAVHADTPPNAVGTAIGFRCVK